MTVIAKSVESELKERAKQLHESGERQALANLKGGIFEKSIISFDPIKNVLFQMETKYGKIYFGTN